MIVLANHVDIEVGDIVVAGSETHPLRLGDTWYAFAICIADGDSVLLIGEDGKVILTLRNRKVHKSVLRPIGKVTDEQMKAAMAAYRGANPPKVEPVAMSLENVVYRVCWTEYEYGQRPEGVSYSESLDALQKLIVEIESAGSTDCYMRASEITQCLVNPELLAEIRSKENGLLWTNRHEHPGVIAILTPVQRV